ncbi:MAG: flagellar hook protein, partial [Thermodesulfobacteriota bacterium]|nr:flagellar hook protein [Thermodesulfobacteriota bacterium]
TATDDGSSHLVLTHDNYGSNYEFTITEDASLDSNKLWTSGDQTVNNGVDVAGTINGEAATGTGQILTGNDDENSIDGLSIKYTGSSTGSIGTVKLTLGVAELFDRALFNITDPYLGYVAYKQDSLQDEIDSMEDQIKQMELRLDQKMETMINRFIVMETALARIQNMSNWLSSQLSGLNNN